MNAKLTQFVAHAKSKGMDAATLRIVLLSAGWKEKDVASALVSESLEMPVPIPTDSGSAKDAFFHLLVFASLYSVVVNLIILSFLFIERLFPDVSTSSVYTESVSGMRWSLAFIIISFPLFVFLSRVVHKDFLAVPEKLGSGVRKWLTYLTLFITACTIVGDLVTLLFYFLDGELSVRFLLKVGAVLLLTALPFVYYFSALRMDDAAYRRSGLHRIFLSIAFVLAVFFVIYGIAVAGSPTHGRNERFDEQRLNDLRAVQNQVYEFVYGPDRYPTKAYTALPRPLPKTLDEIAASSTYQRLGIVDPETQAPYTYSIEASSFRLCAVFTLERNLEYDIFWNHPAGEHCFTFDALDPRSK